jgi:Ser/Thr protein kinase RdoA (MazF antagonist)
VTALVHGLAGDLTAPDWPPLTAGELARVLAAPVRVTWTSPRPLSAAALVELDGRPVFVKRHARAVRTPEHLADEHRFASHLRAHGVPVPEVLGLRAVGNWVYEVHAPGGGCDAYRDVPSWQPFLRPAHARATGGALARLASAGASYRAPARPPQPLVTSWQAVRHDDLRAGLAAFVAARPLLGHALRGRPWEHDVAAVLQPLHDRLRPHLSGLPEGWTHGDGHASNFLWDGDEVSDVLDLGLADRTTALLDLATAVERSCVSWLDADPVADLGLADGLLEGWRQERADDLAALPALLPLAHLEFALSELAYYDGVVGSRSSADLAYAYAVDHARWWSSPAGERLLTHLRRL